MSARSARADEHRYFLAAAVVVASLVLWAFSFEYRDLMHPGQFTVLVQMHGLVMFTWVGCSSPRLRSSSGIDLYGIAGWA
ncbi:MAG: hypothetical protein ACRETR_06935 [Steroidobacteraceae bacterium]